MTSASRLIAIVAALVGLGNVARSSPPATAREAPASVAVVTPLIDALRFGDTVALPLACSTGVAAVGAAVQSQPELSSAVGPVFTEISFGCASFSTQAATHLDSAKQAVVPLSGINPVANPLIDAVATSLGPTPEPAARSGVPFADTLAELGDTIGWFAG